MPKVICKRCRGAKIISGMGGINRDCHICKGEGTIIIKAPEPYKILEAISEAEEVEVVEPLKSAPVEVVASAKKNKINAPVEAVVETLPLEMPPVVHEIFPGYSNDVMQALFDENKMDGILWRQKYKHVKELFKVDGAKIDELASMSKVERNSIRESYALSQPRAARTVDTMAMQDSSVDSDKDYEKFKAQEAAKEAKKKV